MGPRELKGLALVPKKVSDVKEEKLSFFSTPLICKATANELETDKI